MGLGHHAQVLRLMQQIRGGLVVAMVTVPGDPFHDPRHLVPMAQSVELGGAYALVTGSVHAYQAVSTAVTIPVIAANIDAGPGGHLGATQTVASANALIEAGAQAILVDASQRLRPDRDDLPSIVESIHAAGAVALGFVGEPSDLAPAFDAGLDILGTNPFEPTGPDATFLRWLVRHAAVPVFSGGSVSTPDRARLAMEAGAAFVVAGDAITNPAAITARFAAATQTTRQR